MNFEIFVVPIFDIDLFKRRYKPKNHLFVPAVRFVLYVKEIKVDNLKIIIKA